MTETAFTADVRGLRGPSDAEHISYGFDGGTVAQELAILSNASGIAYNGWTVQQQLDLINYSLGGLAMSIIGLAATPSQAEIGSTVPTVTLTWALNHAPTGQTINGVALSDQVNARSKTYSNVTANTNYTLVATDAAAPGGATSDTKTVSIAFLNKGHAGTINKADGATLTSADVNGMSQSWFADSISRTLTFTTTADGRVWYSQPASQADPTTFKINGFVVTATKTTRAHTTATGQTAFYKDFLLSDILSPGAAIVLEVFA